VPGLKVAVQLASFRLPMRKALIAASRLGAAAVEIDARGELNPQNASDTAMRDFKRLLEDLNLRVAAVGFQTRRGYDVPDDIERRVAATKAAQKFARALGSSVVINQVGHVPDEPGGPGWDLLVQSLADLGAHGQKVGALLAAQTGTESGASLARLIEALPAGSLGVDLDPANLITSGFAPLEAIAALGPHITHVHARDAVRDQARGRGVEVQLGRGSADFPALLGALEEHGYRGYFTVAREDSDRGEEEIGEGIQYLKSL